jgi:hypothetical protein
MTISEKPEDSRKAEQAALDGQAVQDYSQTLLAEQPRQPPATEISPEGETNARPIWQVAGEIMQDVPDEELQRLPTDLAENLDHYLYGAPRKQVNVMRNGLGFAQPPPRR